ncbi:cysteine hydrolase family protein [Xanthobacter sediminis]|uniref:cysteine hydrolase family protein n=1 Tax=Xanthobacter sediminis TaxID=3119926 RepID=UPI003729C87F
MSKQFSISLEKSALLIMDFQNVILDNYLSADQAATVLANTAKLLSAAREAKMRIIYVMVAFRHGHPEISPRNKLFSIVKEHGLFARGGADTSFHSAVSPTNEEPIVIKHRIGAFTGTDLEMLLRAKHVETLVLAGVTTTGVVLSTVGQAFDRDYRVIVARDCCGDPDEEVHQMLLDKVISQHAEIVAAQEIITALREIRE